MKTKLTSLLALTFLFLFSGNSFGGIFDKKDENVILYCTCFSCPDAYYSVDIKNKVISQYIVSYGDIKKGSTFKIEEEREEEDEIFLFGKEEGKNVLSRIRVDKYKYENIVELRIKILNKQGEKLRSNSYTCKQGDKMF
jgi:hypothetical protein